MQPLLLWNNTKYAQKLSEFFGKDFVITDSRGLAKVSENLNQYNSLIVLCELDWNLDFYPVRHQHFSGIDIVKKLRLKELRLPILFTSFLSREQIFKTSPDYDILKAIGHKFIQLPAIPEEFIGTIKSMDTLTVTELKDIQLFSCSIDGIVNARIHQLESLAGKMTLPGIEYVSQELEHSIKEVFALFQLNPQNFLSKFKAEFPEIDDSNINKAINSVTEKAKELIGNYRTKNGQIEFKSQLKRDWKLLLLDDEINEDSDLVKLLSKSIDVICRSNAKDATYALEKDDSLRGKISLILTDYRLYEINSNETLVQQKTQGYSFLQNVGQRFQSKLVSAIVYSGMPRQFLLDTFKTYKIRTEIYSKIDFKLNDVGARNFLANRIIENGDANYEAMLALPLANSGWKDHLHTTYLLYRNQRDYEIKEREVCEFCTNWVEKFKIGQPLETPMIKGDTFNPEKVETDDEKLNRFEAFYKTRRLAQFLNLYFENRKNEDVQENIIKHLAKYAKATSYSTPESRRRFFSQTLGFKREEFPFGATMEELCWFQYDLKIDILDGYNRYRSKLFASEFLLGEFISGITILKDILAKANFKYKSDRDHELIFNHKSFEPYFFDKLDFGLCMEWVDKQKEKFNEQIVKDYIILINQLKEIWN